MKQATTLKHEFVEFIPEELREGVLYISIRFATVSHLCVCGCKSKVVTPLRPTDWKLIFDGKTISLNPSIGNWSFPCRSHYWITNNQVQWAEQWSQEKIDIGRSYDRQVKESYFSVNKTDELLTLEKAETKVTPTKKVWWQKLWAWLSK